MIFLLNILYGCILGAPVVASSAVQLNTPLGPIVMGEVSPLNSNFNPMEAQNDQHPQQNDECFCPKKGVLFC